MLGYPMNAEDLEYSAQVIQTTFMALDNIWSSSAFIFKEERLMDENGWDAFVRVSLRLESRSRKVLEKQYLFRGSYKLSFCLFFK